MGNVKINRDNVKEYAQRNEEEIKILFKKLRKRKPKNLDQVVHPLHEKASSCFDCLGCANCCSSISPIITDRDIERLAKHLRIKSAALIEQYMQIDEDGDYVFKETPCPFLMPDNYCMVYEHRPKACREYPHTDRRKFIQILNLTLKNREICPIVYAVTEELQQKFR
jgi:Fe-S-cluster containining protein